MRLFLASSMVLLGACGSGGADDEYTGPVSSCNEPTNTKVGVINQIAIARAVDGVSTGFDLDGEVSVQNGFSGCGVQDFVSPEGVEGIDNAMSGLMPVLEATEAAALEPLLNQAINSGELLLLFQMDSLDGTKNDDCVDFSLLRGAGEPFIGTHDRIDSGQTFDVDPSVDPAMAEGVTVEDGALIARNLSVRLPFEMFDAKFDLFLDNVAFRVNFEDDGSYTGQMAGGFDYAEIAEVLADTNVDQTLADALPLLLGQAADLAPDETGQCTQMSVTLDFEGVSAWLFDDPPPTEEDEDPAE